MDWAKSSTLLSYIEYRAQHLYYILSTELNTFIIIIEYRTQHLYYNNWVQSHYTGALNLFQVVCYEEAGAVHLSLSIKHQETSRESRTLPQWLFIFVFCLSYTKHYENKHNIHIQNSRCGNSQTKRNINKYPTFSSSSCLASVIFDK